MTSTGVTTAQQCLGSAAAGSAPRRSARVAARGCSRNRPPGVAGTRRDFQGSKVSYILFLDCPIFKTFITNRDEVKCPCVLLLDCQIFTFLSQVGMNSGWRPQFSS